MTNPSPIYTVRDSLMGQAQDALQYARDALAAAGIENTKVIAALAAITRRRSLDSEMRVAVDKVFKELNGLTREEFRARMDKHRDDPLARGLAGKPSIPAGQRAALRDASWFNNPSTSGKKLSYHVVRDDNSGRGRCGVMVITDDGQNTDATLPAESIEPALRCRRPGCADHWPEYSK